MLTHTLGEMFCLPMERRILPFSDTEDSDGQYFDVVNALEAALIRLNFDVLDPSHTV